MIIGWKVTKKKNNNEVRPVQMRYLFIAPLLSTTTLSQHRLPSPAEKNLKRGGSSYGVEWGPIVNNFFERAMRGPDLDKAITVLLEALSVVVGGGVVVYWNSRRCQ